jgi:hypothetical protein
MARINSKQFADHVYEALKAAFSALLADNQGQTFYAFGLWTDDSLQFMHPAANTEEALTATVRRYRESVDPKYGTTSTRTGMRWSYGDWGFFPYENGDHFAEVNRILGANFDRMVEDDDFDGGLADLWAAALSGFRRLESEGFFGTGPARSAVTLMLLGDLPDKLVQQWVSALNPPAVAKRFAEYDPDARDGND